MFYHQLNLMMTTLITPQNGKKFYVSQVDDFKHVDSTGAGDAFLAGFIYGLYHEKSFEDSIPMIGR